MEIMRLVAPVVTNEWVVYGVAGALVLWAICSGLFLWRGTARLRRALEKATHRVGEAPEASAFAAQYESIAAELSNDPILGSRWHEFGDSLVLPRTPHGPVRSTTRAASWFDLGLLRAPGIGTDLRYHQALPNLLVGAGLLFTFLGLAVALASAGGVVSGGPDARNSALRNLLDTASFKFVTSLVGLLLSILYALYRKNRLKAVERDLDAFVAALEKRIPLLTPVSLQRDANDILERQATFLEGFSNDLAVSIGNAFDRAFDTRLGGHIEPLRVAIERLSERLSSQTEDGMARMLDAFLERLQGSTGDRMTGVVETMGMLAEELRGMQSGFADAAIKMARSADEMATRIGSGTNEALDRIVAQVGRSATLLGDHTQQNLARLSEQMVGMLSNMEALARQTRETGTEEISRLVLRLEAAAGVFDVATEKASQELNRAASESGGAFHRSAEAASARIAESAALAAGAIGDQVRAAVESATRALAEAAQQVSAAGTDARAALTRGGESAAGFIEGAGTALAGRVTSLSERISLLTDAAARIAAAADEMAARMGAGAEEALGRIVAQVEAAVSRLGGQTDQNLGQLSARLADIMGQLDGLAQRREEAGTEALSNVMKRLEKASHVFDAAAASASDELNKATTTTGEVLSRAAVEASAKIAESAAAAVAEIGESLRAAVAGATAALGDAGRALSAAGSEAQAALTRGGETAGARLEGAGTSLAQRADGLGGRIGALTQAADSIVVRFREFDEAARNASAPLLAAAGDLRAAGEASRASVQPLAQAAGTVGRTLEALTSANRSFEQTQAAATRLSASLTDATSRFAGLDRELAGTLSSLQEGLQRFTAGVKDCVSASDTNLSKAATHLANLVTSLENALEDYAPVVAANGSRMAVSANNGQRGSVRP